MELRVGDPELTDPIGRTGTIDWRRLRRSFRFAFGLTGLFLSTVALSLTLLALVTTVIPRWQTTVVASESMEPALRRGDTVLYSQESIDDVDIGNVVVFDDQATSTIHRVVDINPDGTLVTRGDANGSNDVFPVADSELSGVGRVVVPWVGIVRLWWIDGRYGLVISTILIFLVALRGAATSSEPDNDPWIDTEAASPAGDWLWTTRDDRDDREREDDMELIEASVRGDLLDALTGAGV